MVVSQGTAAGRVSCTASTIHSSQRRFSCFPHLYWLRYWPPATKAPMPPHPLMSRRSALPIPPASGHRGGPGRRVERRQNSRNEGQRRQRVFRQGLAHRRRLHPRPMCTPPTPPNWPKSVSAKAWPTQQPVSGPATPSRSILRPPPMWPAASASCATCAPAYKARLGALWSGRASGLEVSV